MAVVIGGITQAPAGTIGGDLTITGDVTIQGTTTSTVNQTISGTVIIDLDNSEALLVRRDGDAGDVLVVDTVNTRVGIGGAPNAPLGVIGTSPGSVGGFSSGALQLTSSSTDVNANAVITGHNSNAGNKQLWYLGSTSSSNDNIALINRQNGSVSLNTNNVERVKVDSVGNVAIGPSGPTARLHVDQDSAAGLVPVLFLEQADISEEMITFDSTIGVGNAIEAVGAKTLTTTHFIKVTLPGSLTRYLPVGTIA